MFSFGIRISNDTYYYYAWNFEHWKHCLQFRWFYLWYEFRSPIGKLFWNEILCIFLSRFSYNFPFHQWPIVPSSDWTKRENQRKERRTVVWFCFRREIKHRMSSLGIHHVLMKSFFSLFLSLPFISSFFISHPHSREEEKKVNSLNCYHGLSAFISLLFRHKVKRLTVKEVSVLEVICFWTFLTAMPYYKMIPI